MPVYTLPLFFFCCRHFCLFSKGIDFDRACLLSLLSAFRNTKKRKPFPKTHDSVERDNMRDLVGATQSKYNKEMCLKPAVNTFLIPKVNCPQTLKQPVFRHFKTSCGWILPWCGDFTLGGHARAREVDSLRGVEELFLYFALCSAVYYWFGFLFLPAEC